jgi:hypothetical protein
MIVKLKEGEYFGDQLMAVETSDFKLSSTYNLPDSKTIKHMKNGIQFQTPVLAIK